MLCFIYLERNFLSGYIQAPYKCSIYGWTLKVDYKGVHRLFLNPVLFLKFTSYLTLTKHTIKLAH